MAATSVNESNEINNLTGSDNGPGSVLQAPSPLLDVLKAVTGITAVLNEDRQILYANEEFLQLLGMKGIESVLGKRPGEAVACIHASETGLGCGTSDACSVCGSVTAIKESQKSGRKTVRETRVTTISDGVLRSWDIKVGSSPLKLGDKILLLFTVEDISPVKRRENLERAFFHDILNSAGNLNSLMMIMKDEPDPSKIKEIMKIAEEASQDLIDEIFAHRQIRDAENGDLAVKIENFDANELFRSVICKMINTPLAGNKRIIFNEGNGTVLLKTDRIILKRILMNLIKNSLEASEKSGIIQAGTDVIGDDVILSVKNDTVMSEDVRRQIFQRSFTTKGPGRGLGTYSIRLLTENYLKGKVNFTSSENEGTIFRVILPQNGPKTN